MKVHSQYSGRLRPVRAAALAFTLIELLTVIAIISLLISILVPSVSKARDAAKNTKTRAIMKNMGDSLEMFAHDNQDELHGLNYPSSKAGDDPTETGFNDQDMCGAQWVVRYLMGKRLDGYVPARVVDPNSVGPVGEEQLHWYDNPPPGQTEPFSRSGPYLEPGVVKLKSPKNIVGSTVTSADVTPRYNNPVIVDAFEMPICYYAANSVMGARVNAPITAFIGDPNDPSSGPGDVGVFTFKDNALFTGLCYEGQCLTYATEWDFGGGPPKLNYGDPGWITGMPTNIATVIKDHPNSFAYYIMNKDAYEASSPVQANKAVVPNRRDSYILISPGKDGRFGTGDDVTNF
jgi:prepilin-type N-terminal cleavage/methylation domain-containing protein